MESRGGIKPQQIIGYLSGLFAFAFLCEANDIYVAFRLHTSYISILRNLAIVLVACGMILGLVTIRYIFYRTFKKIENATKAILVKNKLLISVLSFVLVVSIFGIHSVINLFSIFLSVIVYAIREFIRLYVWWAPFILIILICIWFDNLKL